MEKLDLPLSVRQSDIPARRRWKETKVEREMIYAFPHAHAQPGRRGWGRWGVGRMSGGRLRFSSFFPSINPCSPLTVELEIHWREEGREKRLNFKGPPSLLGGKMMETLRGSQKG